MLERQSRAHLSETRGDFMPAGLSPRCQTSVGGTAADGRLDTEGAPTASVSEGA